MALDLQKHVPTEFSFPHPPHSPLKKKGENMTHFPRSVLMLDQKIVKITFQQKFNSSQSQNFFPSKQKEENG